MSEGGAVENVIGGIAYPANKYGRVIYEAALEEIQ